MIDESTPPDWARLRELSQQAEALSAQGEMTVDRYRELLEQATQACNGHPEFVESLTHFAPADDSSG